MDLEARTDFFIVVDSPVGDLLARLFRLGAAAAVVTVGRHADNDIVLACDSVSRRHARVEKREDGWWVVDGGSTHGTFVNGARVQAAPLRRGDRVRFGATTLKLAEDDAHRPADGREYAPPQVDGLTGASSRHAFAAAVERALEHPERAAAWPTLVLFDVDRLKAVNDAHGHRAGDQVLREVASLARRHARPGDVFARCGGDEFALLLVEAGVEVGAALAEAIRAAVAAHPFTLEGRAVALTVSVGVAQADGDTRDASGLMRSVEARVAAAKRAGGNRVVVA